MRNAKTDGNLWLYLLDKGVDVALALGVPIAYSKIITGFAISEEMKAICLTIGWFVAASAVCIVYYLRRSGGQRNGKSGNHMVGSVAPVAAPMTAELGAVMSDVIQNEELKILVRKLQTLTDVATHPLGEQLKGKRMKLKGSVRNVTKHPNAKELRFSFVASGVSRDEAGYYEFTCNAWFPENQATLLAQFRKSDEVVIEGELESIDRSNLDLKNPRIALT